MTFIWGQFHKRCLCQQSLKLAWELLTKNYIQISQGPIPMYRLWLNSLYGLYGPRCPLSSKRPMNLISLSLSLSLSPKGQWVNFVLCFACRISWSHKGDDLRYLNVSIVKETEGARRRKRSVHQLSDSALLGARRTRLARQAGKRKDLNFSTYSCIHNNGTLHDLHQEIASCKTAVSPVH